MAKKTVKLAFKGLEKFTADDRAFVATWLNQKAREIIEDDVASYSGRYKATIEFPAEVQA